MINRPLRVQFRLTKEEYSRYMPMIEKQHLWTWSDLVRVALKKFWTDLQPTASDNGVRHADRPSDSQTPRAQKQKQATGRTPVKSRQKQKN